MIQGLSILERVLAPEQGDLPISLAELLLKLEFPQADHRRFATLSEKSREGQLSAVEREELQEYLDINDFISLLKAKARASLQRRSPAA